MRRELTNKEVWVTWLIIMSVVIFIVMPLVILTPQGTVLIIIKLIPVIVIIAMAGFGAFTMYDRPGVLPIHQPTVIRSRFKATTHNYTTTQPRVKKRKRIPKEIVTNAKDTLADLKKLKGHFESMGSDDWYDEDLEDEAPYDGPNIDVGYPYSEPDGNPGRWVKRMIVDVRQATEADRHIPRYRTIQEIKTRQKRKNEMMGKQRIMEQVWINEFVKMSQHGGITMENLILFRDTNVDKNSENFKKFCERLGKEIKKETERVDDKKEKVEVWCV